MTAYTGLHCSGAPDFIYRLLYEGEKPRGNVQFYKAQAVALDSQRYPPNQIKDAQASAANLKTQIDALCAEGVV